MKTMLKVWWLAALGMMAMTATGCAADEETDGADEDAVTETDAHYSASFRWVTVLDRADGSVRACRLGSTVQLWFQRPATSDVFSLYTAFTDGSFLSRDVNPFHNRFSTGVAVSWFGYRTIRAGYDGMWIGFEKPAGIVTAGYPLNQMPAC